MWVTLIPLLIILFLLLSYTKKKCTVGVVSTIKDPHQFDTWIKFHLKSGISKIYIYWDGENPPTVSDPRVSIQVMDDAFLKSKDWKENPDWDNPLRTNAKQDLAVDDALSKNEVDYMFHFDADELLYTPDQDIPGVLSDYASEECDTWSIENIELAPDSGDYENCFTEGTKFRRHGSNFVAYGNGKGCGRVGHSASFGPHRLRSTRDRPEGSLPFERIRILHFVSCNIKEYLKKYQQYGDFKNDKWEWAQFHLKSRDQLKQCEGDSCMEKAREMFQDRLVKPQEEVIENPVSVASIVGSSANP
jgi:hypothetical protein